MKITVKYTDQMFYPVTQRFITLFPYIYHNIHSPLESRTKTKYIKNFKSKHGVFRQHLI